MNNHVHIPAKVSDFSLAFQQMCSMVAIGQTKSPDETLRELILQSLVLFPEEKLSNDGDFKRILSSIFGLQIEVHEIKFALDLLVTEGGIRLTDVGYFVVNPNLSSELRRRIDDAYSLEGKVRDGWFEQLLKYPLLQHSEMWVALKLYLAGAFLRHGIQTVALLDASIELDHIYSQSLSELLNDAVKGFPFELQLDAKNAISNFVATSGQFPERAAYITQLADGAFSYFSLSTDPNTASSFRKNLNPLLLFLDTNFLFGILGLTVNPQVAVSNELIRVIKQYTFPFRLKRLVKTQNELLASVTGYETDFSSRHWSQNISRAALTSRFLSGVELRYHQAYIETGIDVKSFFRPFHHADILLDEKSIERYNDTEHEQTTERIATLISDYTDFLKRRNKEKTYRKIDHDMTLLDVVRGIRTDAKSTLEAGALIITCDYSLYAFDWETSRKQGIMPCTVLPNLFWQILRPFIPSDTDFCQAFAQTFAIPEFRTISSGAAEACSKMINIMSGYKTFPEDTASRMLSNDVLIDQLRKAENDETFQQYVEIAIVTENEQLLGKNQILEKKFRVEQEEKATALNRLAEVEKETQQKDEAISLEKQQRLNAEQLAQAEKDKRVKAEKRLELIISLAASLLTGIALIIIFEVLINLLSWTWLLNHPNSYGLQGAFDLLLLLSGFIAFAPKWRKFIAISLILPVGGIVLQLLGGPK